jgi:hypothetical protein
VLDISTARTDTIRAAIPSTTPVSITSTLLHPALAARAREIRFLTDSPPKNAPVTL